MEDYSVSLPVFLCYFTFQITKRKFLKRYSVFNMYTKFLKQAFIYVKYVFIMWQAEWQGETKKKERYTGLFPQMATWSVMGQAEAKSSEMHLALSGRWLDLSNWTSSAAFPRTSAGSWVRSGAPSFPTDTTVIWDAAVTSSGSTCCSTTAAPACRIFRFSSSYI